MLRSISFGDGNPRIVLLGAHRWSRQPVVELAKQAGFDPILLLYSREQLDPQFADNLSQKNILRHADEVHVDKLAKTLSAQGCGWYALGLDDYVCELAANLSAFSSRKTMPSAAPKETLQKHLLRLRWNNICNGRPDLFPVPFRFLRYSDRKFSKKISEEQDGNFQEDCNLIIKPDALDASIGIKSVNSWAEAESAIDALRVDLCALANEVMDLGIDISPGIIIEHKIPRSRKLHPGAEFSAEFLTTRFHANTPAIHHFIGITQKYINAESFVEVAHCFPSESFPTQLVDTVREVTSVLLKELGVEFAISHWEYIVTDDDRLALVEAQLRPAGDRIMDLVRRATDIDPYIALFDALNIHKNSKVPNFVNQRSAAVFFPRPDRLVAGNLSIIQEAQFDKDSSWFVGVDLATASAWGPDIQWYSKHLAVITVGADFSAAHEQCKEFLGSLKVVNKTQVGEERVSLSIPCL